MGDGFGLRLRKAYKYSYDFLSESWITTHDEAQASRLQRFAHFWLLVFKSFARNKGPLRATALAFTTLLGLVPLLAVGFGIAASLLNQKGAPATREILHQFVDAAIPQLKVLAETNKVSSPKGTKSSVVETTDPREQVVTYLSQFIQNAQSKTLGITGILGFIVVAVMLLSTIEDTFNDIWGVTRGRSWFRRFVQYWTTISLGPVVVALAVTLMGQSIFRSLQPTGATLALCTKWTLSFLVVSTALAFFYKVMPNTQVHWRAASVAGAVGGGLWLLMNYFSTFQGSKVLQMSRIYGTLSLIPISLLGLYFSWLILLFGAQVAYALQNRKMYLQERKAESVNQRGREYVALRIMAYLAQRFDHGAKPPTVLELGTVLGVPSRLIGRVLGTLTQAGIVLEVVGGNEAAFTPARPLEGITCHDIIQTMRVAGGQELATRDEPTRSEVTAEFERICEAERQAGSAVALRDLVRRLPYVEAHHDPKKVEEFWKKETISS